MESITIDKSIAHLNDEINLTVYCDLHEDSVRCDQKRLLKHMEMRAALPNAMFFMIGDVLEWIVPGDLKRYMPSMYSERNAASKGYDDFIDKSIKEFANKYKKFPIVAFGSGNHCHQVLKRHYTNPAERIANELGAKYAAYSGFLSIRIKDKSRDGTRAGPRAVCTVLYHHGAWGGRVIKGFGGARDWARMHEGYNLMVYGHNHQCVIHQEAVIRRLGSGAILESDRFFVNAGTFVRTQSMPGETPSYGEISGYSPVALAAPLIKIRALKDSTVNVSVTAESMANV